MVVKTIYMELFTDRKMTEAEHDLLKEIIS